METMISPSAAPRRFSTLFAESNCPRPIYDKILFNVGSCVVTPTLGSIIPGWLLIIPREPATNFSYWQAETGINPAGLVSDVLRQADATTLRTIWFEHGPAVHGSKIGCGVDHAHIHLLVEPPFTDEEFFSAIQKSSAMHWREERLAHVYNSIRRGSSYLLAASGEHALVAENVESVGSQFFRRVIARIIGQSEAWNYKTHPCLENVQKTIDRFCSSGTPCLP